MKRLFGGSPASDGARGDANVPAGQRVYAIGDVHGRLDLLTELLDAIDRDDAGRDPAKTTIVLLGDLVDRGPQSKQVIDHLIARDWRGRDVAMIKGNHEEVFLLTLAGDLEATRFWLRIGGAETMMSYGTPAELIDRAGPLDIAVDFMARVPQEHVAFLQSMGDTLVVGGYCFVHAGIKPGVPIDRQKPADLRWIRDRFLDYEGSHGATIVHGHSIATEVESLHNRIGIDTGAYASGKLTAVGLEGERRWFLAT
ncbi:MAG: serine/threonine protein phosphatase [Sphingomonas sp.]|uniref:metallophosphoesterase n=1 Tax=Sphingomonas sp. TaxID=28214 RepID=UPI001204D49E|nr:metallophosphoesterase [Sphingomonas sp.]THD35441.1 MAG: serine/threonine protein phosphatase [Sphingomonas sp.]